MIVEYAEVLDALNRDASLTIQKIHEAVEAAIKAKTGHDWEDTDYVEFIDGTGTASIFLDHYPVDSVVEISPVVYGIKIRNTSTDSRNAYVSVDSDSLDLTVIGGTNAMTATLTFADYATLTLMIAAINAEAKGWTALIYDTDFNSYPSPALMHIKNFFCGSSNGTTPSYSYLKILGKPYSGYEVNEKTGEVSFTRGWARGKRNIIAKYSAYASGQADIQEAVKQAIKFLVKQHEDDTEGVSSYSNDGLSVKFDSIMPSNVLDIIKLHSKLM